MLLIAYRLFKIRCNRIQNKCLIFILHSIGLDTGNGMHSLLTWSNMIGLFDINIFRELIRLNVNYHYTPQFLSEYIWKFCYIQLGLSGQGVKEAAWPNLCLGCNSLNLTRASDDNLLITLVTNIFGLRSWLLLLENLEGTWEYLNSSACVDYHVR